MAGLDPYRSALLVIDAQDSFKASPRWQLRNNPLFEANVARLIDGFRAASAPVVYFLHSDADEYFDVESPHYRLMSFLAPRADEPVMHKTTRSCFASTGLTPLLLRRGVRRLAIAGIQTEQCCETTARAGCELGFDVDFVTEATLTFPIPKTLEPGSESLSADAVVERTEYVLRRRFARITGVDGALAALTAASHA